MLSKSQFQKHLNVVLDKITHKNKEMWSFRYQWFPSLALEVMIFVQWPFSYSIVWSPGNPIANDFQQCDKSCHAGGHESLQYKFFRLEP